MEKVTWKSPDGKIINQIDHVLIQKRFRSCITDVRSFRSADCDADHFMVISTLIISLLGHKKPQEKIKANINVEALPYTRKSNGSLWKNGCELQKFQFT